MALSRKLLYLVTLAALLVCVGVGVWIKLKSGRKEGDFTFLKTAIKSGPGPSDPHLASEMRGISNVSYEFAENPTVMETRIQTELEARGWQANGANTWTGPNYQSVSLFAGRITGSTMKFGVPIPTFADKDTYSTVIVVLIK